MHATRGYLWLQHSVAVRHGVSHKERCTSASVLQKCMASLPNFVGTKTSPRRFTSDYLIPEPDSDTSNRVLLLLNYVLPQCTARLWPAASFHICADGGANRLYDFIPTLYPNELPAAARSRFVPDVIKGDLDSIKPEVRSFYAALGTVVIDESHDQDSTDLQKCLKLIMERARKVGAGTPTIIAVGGLGGRLDHTLSNLNSLLMNAAVDLVLVGEGSLARSLPPGRSLITPAAHGLEGPTCGLIPLAGPAVATTTGLRWNLDNTHMRFGGLVSSSNLMDSPEVTVETDVALIWTTEFKDEA